VAAVVAKGVVACDEDALGFGDGFYLAEDFGVEVFELLEVDASVEFVYLLIEGVEFDQRVADVADVW